MKNYFFERFKNVVLLEIKGKNLERFIHRLASQNIEILDLRYPKVNTVQIKVYSKDLDKIEEIKTIYEISVLDTFGMIKIKKKFNKSRVFFFVLIIGICFLYFLSHIIFDIEVVHTDKNLRNLLLKELDNYGVSKRSFKKSFHQLEQIKKEILERHKDTIEWLEIENVGTKYIVRVEERKINQEITETEPRHVVAKKSAILKKIVADSGEVIKNINDYVQEGDIVISGEIKLNEEIKNITRASGKIYGEVWYQTKVEFPYFYKESFRTGKKKTVYTIKFLNFRFELFNFHPYQKKEITETTIWKHFLLPFSFVKEVQEEKRVTENIYTEEEAIEKAEELGRKKMEEQLKEGEEILVEKNLKVEIKESKIEVDLFFTVLEDITSYRKIEEPKGE